MRRDWFSQSFDAPTVCLLLCRGRVPTFPSVTRNLCHPTRMKLGTSMLPWSSSISKAHLFRTLQALPRDAREVLNGAAEPFRGVSSSVIRQATTSRIVSIDTRWALENIWCSFDTLLYPWRSGSDSQEDEETTKKKKSQTKGHLGPIWLKRFISYWTGSKHTALHVPCVPVSCMQNRWTLWLLWSWVSNFSATVDTLT